MSITLHVVPFWTLNFVQLSHCQHSYIAAYQQLVTLIVSLRKSRC